jgi:hypothetical protein
MDRNLKLNSTAHQVGVKRFGLFHGAGIQAMYETRLAEIKVRRDIGEKEDWLDRQGVEDRSFRYLADMPDARALPPILPSSWAALFLPSSAKKDSSISPVAILMTWTALPVTSAGRRSPLGPRGIIVLAEAGLEYFSQAQRVDV